MEEPFEQTQTTPVVKKRSHVVWVAVLVFIVAGSAGAAAGFFAGQDSMKKYKIAFETTPPSFPTELFGFSGEVVSVADGRLVVQTGSFEHVLPGQEAELQEITVIIDGTTEIVEPAALPPLGGEEQNVLSFTDLKEGDVVSISSTESIIGKQEVLAAEIVRMLEGVNIAEAEPPTDVPGQ